MYRSFWLSLKPLPLIILASALLQTAKAQKIDEPVPFNPQIYRVGERLTYDVSFSQFVSAAHVEVLVAAQGTFFGRKAVELRAHAETIGVVNAALFALNNDYTTYIDPSSGLPFRAQQMIREAGRTADTFNIYNQPGAEPAPIRGRTGGSPGVYDLLSAVYRLRATPLAEGAVYRITVRNEGEDYQGEARVSGRERIQTKVGSFNAIATRISIRNSKINDYRIRVYFSDDERHVPVLITVRHPAGEIRIELAGSKIEAPTGPGPGPRPSPSPVATPSVAPAGPSLPAELPFKIGEQLNYNIYLPSVSQAVGTASYQVGPRARYFNHDGVLLTAKAQTTTAGARLFSVNDQINSYVDPTTLLPFRTELAMVEGQRHTNQTYTVNQDLGGVVTVAGKRIDIPVGTHDLISVIYALRTFDLDPPRRNAISILAHDRPLTLFITSLRRETIDLGDRKIPAIQISLTTDDPQSDKFQFRIWVGDDARRLPLRLTAVTQLGPLRADLVVIPLTPQ